MPDSSPLPAASAQTEPAFSWSWLAAAIGLIAGAAAVFALRRRRRAPTAEAAPQIELLLVNPDDPAANTAVARAASTAPTPVPTPMPTPVPTVASPPARIGGAPGASPRGSLRIEATPTHLTRSLMTATFGCRLSLVNRGPVALENVTIGLDLITAHGSVATGDQVADPARALPQVGTIARIEPGETAELAHEVRLPTAQIRTLRQGAAHLYVPLLHVRAQAGADAPVARTFIIGTLPQPGAQKLQPFRLDEMPQTYRQIGMAAID